MPIYEFICDGCDSDTGERAVIERRIHADEIDDQFCEECGAQLTLTPSRPASFPVGKYGKGNR